MRERLIMCEEGGLGQRVGDGELEEVRMCLERCAYISLRVAVLSKAKGRTEKVIVYARECDVRVVLDG